MFLTIVKTELNQKIARRDIAELCKLDYGIEGVNFGAYSSTNEGWCDTDGLFGWNRDGDVYKRCRDNFDSHLKSEFFNDFSVYDVEDTEIKLGTRDYSLVLKSNFSNVYSIYQEREDTLR